MYAEHYFWTRHRAGSFFYCVFISILCSLLHFFSLTSKAHFVVFVDDFSSTFAFVWLICSLNTITYALTLIHLEIMTSGVLPLTFCKLFCFIMKPLFWCFTSHLRQSNETQILAIINLNVEYWNAADCGIKLLPSVFYIFFHLLLCNTSIIR